MGSEPSERGATQCESSDLRKTMKAVRNPRIHQYFTLYYIYPECTAQGQKHEDCVSASLPEKGQWFSDFKLCMTFASVAFVLACKVLKTLYRFLLT